MQNSKRYVRAQFRCFVQSSTNYQFQTNYLHTKNINHLHHIYLHHTCAYNIPHCKFYNSITTHASLSRIPTFNGPCYNHHTMTTKVRTNIETFQPQSENSKRRTTRWNLYNVASFPVYVATTSNQDFKRQQTAFTAIPWYSYLHTSLFA